MKLKLAILVLALAAIACSAAVHPTTPGTQPTAVPIPFSRAEPSNQSIPEFFKFASGTSTMLVVWNGGPPDLPTSASARVINLRIKDRYFVDSLSFAQIQNDWLLAYGITNHNCGSSFIARIDGQTLVPRWIALVPGFNPGTSLLRGQDLYVTAIGFVGKLGADSGEYIWQHSGLYDSGSFNAFEQPVLIDDRVIFRERTIRSESPKSIEVNDQSGQILGVYQDGHLFQPTATPLPTATPTAQPSGMQNVEFVGQLRGGAGKVAVQGDYAYIGVGPRLSAVNVADKTHPSSVGQTQPLPGKVQDVVVAGNYAYVITSEGSLRVINISNPVNLVEVGSYYSGGMLQSVVVAQNYAYLADSNAGLRIVSIADPSHPTEASLFKTRAALKATVVGHMVYLAEVGGLRIIDVIDPLHPVQAGYYQLPDNACDTGAMAPGVYDVAMNGNYAYLALVRGVAIVDISQPSTPVEIGRLLTPASVHTVAVAENYLYVPTWKALHVADVRDPLQLRQVAVHDQMPVGDLVLSNGYLYTTDGNSLHIMQMVNPSTLPQVGIYTPLGPSYASKVMVAGNTAYVADPQGSSSALWLIDITNPSAPATVASYTVTGYLQDFTIADGYAYLALGKEGLRVVNVADRTHPVKIASYQTLGNANGVAVAGSYAYVTESGTQRDSKWVDGGLRILNIANPVAPIQAGFLAMPRNDPGRLTVDRTTAYLTQRSTGLCVVDISDPSHPTEVSLLETPGAAVDVAVYENIAYIADVVDLRVVNVGDPQHPSEIGMYGVGDRRLETEYVEVSKEFGYLALGQGGVHVLSLANPSAPVQVASYTMNGSVRSVTVSNGYIYIADTGRGLEILRHTPPR